ncbi:MAG: ATP-binding protein, partial [Pirellulaceae bacterium]
MERCPVGTRSIWFVETVVPPEERRREEELKRLRRQYDELAALAGSLAHEIKNPLSIIQMNMELLAEELDGVANTREQRATLLNDFLKFARLSELVLLPGDLNELVRRVLEFFVLLAERQSVEVQLYLDPDLPKIRLDAETLYAAVLNLVKNALEALPNGGSLVARTSLCPYGVALDLIDDGVGIEDRTAMKMFEPFYTTKTGGSGLGLPMSRKIIEAHGGRISVQSEVAKGTKFTLEFPIPAR